MMEHYVHEGVIGGSSSEDEPRSKMPPDDDWSSRQEGRQRQQRKRRRAPEEPRTSSRTTRGSRGDKVKLSALPHHTTKQELRKFFTFEGSILEGDIVQVLKGETDKAVVVFKTPQQAEAAIAKNGDMIHAGGEMVAARVVRATESDVTSINLQAGLQQSSIRVAFHRSTHSCGGPCVDRNGVDDVLQGAKKVRTRQVATNDGRGKTASSAISLDDTGDRPAAASLTAAIQPCDDQPQVRSCVSSVCLVKLGRAEPQPSRQDNWCLEIARARVYVGHEELSCYDAALLVRCPEGPMAPCSCTCTYLGCGCSGRRLT